MSINIPLADTTKDKIFIIFDMVLIIGIALALIAEFSLYLLGIHTSAVNWLEIFLAVFSIMGIVPVAISAVKALIKRHITIDLLASIALAFSLIQHEWSSAAFISLMLAFARIFDHITEARMKKSIKSLMKYHVEIVRVRDGDSIVEKHIDLISRGDMVIIEAGENVPVDGVIISGMAEVNESSLTGENELMPKKVGDQVFTSTVMESGSLIVRVDRVGADTTLSRIIQLVEESSRNKNQAEMFADKFSEKYILIMFLVSITLYLFGVDSKIILAILLVVCADDIAVAVPLTYTSAIVYAAKRGVLIKGSGAFEQLYRMNYLLTDKTGTLTRGKPEVSNIHNYGSRTFDDICRRFVAGASVSRHAVSRAIMKYADEKHITAHIPDQFSEIPGEGITFVHDGEVMFMGRPSYTEHEEYHVGAEVKRDIQFEKDAGRGIVLLGVNKEVVGLLSYSDELRSNVSEIIQKTRDLGIREWHMLTGDNERAASAIAEKLDIKHFHANMSPQHKVKFIETFEKEHGPKATKNPGVVGYIGDGVNDAASLALADVSIAMGGIGSDAAIEAADITIMRDNLERVPEMMILSRKVRRVMKDNFWIWAITNGVGLFLVVIGVPGIGQLGPAGAATYNFLTDFFPIFNSFRAGRK